MSERHGTRPDTPDTEPAPAVTGKARSDQWVLDRRQGGAPVRRMDEPAHTQSSSGLAKGRDVFRVQTNNFTAKQRDADGERSKAGSQPYTRPIDDPAPTVDTHVNGWVAERPSPTIVGTRRSDQGMIVGRQLPEGEGRNVGGHGWTEERPSTSVCGDPRVSPPGYRGRAEDYDAEGNLAPGKRSGDNAVRVTVEEASILQSFPLDHPWDGLTEPPHIAAGLGVELNQPLPHEFVSDLRERGVGFTVRVGTLEDGKVLEAVVVPDAVDVVNDLARLRPGDVAVLRGHALAGDEDVASSVELGSSRQSLGASLIRVERITVEPPLLPVSGTPTAGGGFAFAVLARRLGWAPVETEGAVPGSLVVHEAETPSGVLPVAAFDVASSHLPSVAYRPAGNSRSKQFQQIGNAVPPLMAKAVLSALLEATEMREAA